MRYWIYALLLSVLLPTAASTDDRWPSRSGGGSNPFAVNGASLTNESVAIMLASKGPASFKRTGGWTTYYFSSAAGGDLPAGASTGTGTAADPMDASLLDNYCISPGVMCILDSGETFVFPATIRTNTSTCTQYPDEPCIIITTTGDARATITTALTAATDGPIFAFDGATTDAGWVVVNNVNVISNAVTAGNLDLAAEADNADAFSVNSGSGTHTKALLWNTAATVTGDLSDNGYTSHGSNGTLVIVNGACFMTSASINTNPCVSPITGSQVVAIGLAVTQDTTNLDSQAVNIGTSTGSGTMSMAWVDGFVEFPDPAPGGRVIELNPDSSSTVTATIARVGITTANDTSSCVRFTASGATAEVINYTSYQTTVTGCTDGVLWPNGAIDAAARLTVAITAMTCDNVADNCLSLADSEYDDTTALTVSTLLFDDTDSADVFHIETGGAASTEDSDDLTALQVDIDADAPTFTINVGAATGIETNDAQVQWSNASTTFAQLGCQSINDCWAAYDSTYPVTFPVALPAWVAGVRVTGATLNGTDGNIGR